METFYLGEPKPHDETGRPWYDTKAGITENISSLEKLIELILERHTAGYERDEQLNEFHIMGRYNLDTCGNCSKAQGVIPKEILPEIPDVLTRDEFSSYINEQIGKKGLMLSFSHNGGNIPPTNIECGYCGKKWTIEDCYDTVVKHSTEHVSLADFVGNTLSDVAVFYNQKVDAIYMMQPELLIRNDRFIDMSSRYPNDKDDYKRSIVKNERGWVGEKDGITDEYIIQTGDESYLNVWKYFHQACNHANSETVMRDSFKNLFEKSGFKEIEMSTIANEYCPCEMCSPWFIVTTEFGKIKIGWRKRVINIDWTDVTLPPRKKLLSLFKSEEVTKGPTGIHAWGWEKAQEYLSKIYNYLS